MTMVCEPWPLAAHCLPKGWPADPAQWDDAQRAAVETASEILKRLSGGVFGLCSLKVRPCRKRCEGGRDSLDRYALGVVGGPWTPSLMDGRIYNISCGCTGQCGCSPLCEMILDPYAYDILQVRIDGVVLPSTAYRVDDNRRLVRTDGGCWPDCQELTRPDTEKGTFSITYRTGVPVPAGGRMAVTELAVQLWKACCGGKGCTLSDRVTQVVREGITYTLDNLDIFERGRTGLNRVDLWLASVNPFGARGPLRAFSPDTIRARRTTFPDPTLPAPPPFPPAPPLAFRWVQPSASQVWTIAHNLGFYPAGVRVEDSTGTDTVGEVTYPDINTVRVDFNSPVSGVAYLS